MDLFKNTQPYVPPRKAKGAGDFLFDPNQVEAKRVCRIALPDIGSDEERVSRGGLEKE